MRILSKILKWLMVIWTFITNKDNLKIVQPVLNIAEEVAKHTKTELDNAALASIAAYIRNETKGLGRDDLKKVEDAINKASKGSLRNVQIGLSTKDGVKLGLPFGAVQYNHNDGSVKWQKEFKF